MITITHESTQSFESTGFYLFADIECGKNSIAVAIGPRSFRVIVNNASHHAWGGMGKCFDDAAHALRVYKNSTTRAMILAAAERYAELAA